MSFAGSSRALMVLRAFAALSIPFLAGGTGVVLGPFDSTDVDTRISSGHDRSFAAGVRDPMGS